MNEPLNCCNPPRSDQTHLVLTISNPPGVEAFAEGRLTNLQCVAHATHQHASRADKVVARRNPDKASLHATIDNNLLRERNGPSADDRTPDVEPITSAASARATTTLTALFAAATDPARSPHRLLPPPCAEPLGSRHGDTDAPPRPTIPHGQPRCGSPHTSTRMDPKSQLSPPPVSNSKSPQDAPAHSPPTATTNLAPRWRRSTTHSTRNSPGW